MNQENLERDVIIKIIQLEGRENKEILKEQFEKSKVIKREFTGVGFFTHFSIPDNLPKCKKMNFELGEIEFKINKIKDPFGIILFIREGKIDFLECYSYGSDYPNKIKNYELLS